MPLLLLSTDKQCILSNFIYNSTAMFLLKTLYPGRDSNPGLLVPEADAMSTAPRRQGNFVQNLVFDRLCVVRQLKSKICRICVVRQKLKLFNCQTAQNLSGPIKFCKKKCKKRKRFNKARAVVKFEKIFFLNILNEILLQIFFTGIIFHDWQQLIRDLYCIHRVKSTLFIKSTRVL
jgi:hypothetical protein